MVLGTATVLGDPVVVVKLRRFDLGSVVVELLLGEESGFDTLRQLDFLLGVQQGDLADLLQVVLDWVSSGTGSHDLLLRLVRVVGLRQGEAFILGKLLLELCLFSRLERGLIDVVERPLLPDGEDDLFTFEIYHHISGQFCALNLDIQLIQGEILKLNVIDCFRLNGIWLNSIWLSQRYVIGGYGLIVHDRRRRGGLSRSRTVDRLQRRLLGGGFLGGGLVSGGSLLDRNAFLPSPAGGRSHH